MLSVRSLTAIANAAFLAICQAGGSPPNVVVIGYRTGASPMMDSLAKEGVDFPRTFAAPTPVKTLAAWLTGCHELRAGVIDDHGGRNFIHPEIPVLAESFKAAGYRTAFHGDWGMGDAFPFRPEDRGFDEVLLPSMGRAGDRWDVDEAHWVRNRAGWKSESGSLETTLAQQTSTWLRARSEAREKFFLQLNLAEGTEKVAGAVIEELDRLSLENTVVVGIGMVPRGFPESDPQTRMVIRWKGHVSGGKVRNEAVSVIDGAPTLVSLCGLPHFKDWRYDGVDLSSLLLNPSESLAQLKERSLFFHAGDWPSDQSPDRHRSDSFSVRSGHWRLAGLELTDLRAEKKTDEFEKHPEVADRLLQLYGSWWQEVRPSLSPTRVIVGDERQKVVSLTWRGWWPSREVLTSQWEVMPDQAALKEALQKLADAKAAETFPEMSGSWKIRVSRAGHYQVTMRKVPAEATAERVSAWGRLRAGTAHVRAGKFEAKAKLLEGAHSISLGIDMNEGPVDLEAWFEGQTGKGRVLGAFFITIERVGERKFPDTKWDVKQPGPPPGE